MTPSTVCFGAKDSTYGGFKIPSSGSIINFKLTYLSGSVNCYAPNPGYKSNWGCKYPSISTHPMGTHITDSNRNHVLPKDEYLNGGPGCGYYKFPWATPDSPELIFDDFAVPMSVISDQEFQLWFGEDLVNCGESDNGLKKTCAEVYGLYV